MKEKIKIKHSSSTNVSEDGSTINSHCVIMSYSDGLSINSLWYQSEPEKHDAVKSQIISDAVSWLKKSRPDLQYEII